MRPTAHKLITYDFEKPILELERKLEELRRMATEQKVDLHDQIAEMEKTVEETKQNVYTHLSAWQRVQLARHPRRPYTLDYLAAFATDFVELHGDRRFSDDRAMVGGFATIDDVRVVIVGQQKGRDTKENIMRNFGCAHPEGYRKAMRLMQMAERFGLPIVTFIDTPGAYPGVGAEERHIAEAIAANLRDMMALRVPIVAAVIGEGGSGGALGIGIANRVLIMENAYYSVISPEGCAAILWKDRAATPKAAEALKLTAKDLLGLKLVEEIIPEPLGGAHRDPAKAAAALKAALLTNLRELIAMTPEALLEQRYAKFRAMGQFDFVVPGGNV
ncbi:MAG: acetyl-CoA carboxylase carboxyltransferase subunit alpha [Verrucomicrobia bacterium GWF2_62_7]|nr:MAG: acetyl-CoA carboxylase carboxyltransferase subunit alpha [Verrucomicrobia bacterium GWF2_62_7]